MRSIEKDHLWDRISVEEIERLGQIYERDINDALRALEDERQRIIADVRERREASNAHLRAEEVVTLVEWKLKHGKFRPNLLSLARSNAEAAVQETTAKAFDELAGGSRVAAMTELKKLRGIGPATASLLLATYDPSGIPFFSDELYRWAKIEERDVEDKKTSGLWERPITYVAREYEELHGQVEKMRERLGAPQVDCLTLDKAAFALARLDSTSATPEQQTPSPQPVAKAEVSGRKRKERGALAARETSAAKLKAEVDTGASREQPRRSKRMKK